MHAILSALVAVAYLVQSSIAICGSTVGVGFASNSSDEWTMYSPSCGIIGYEASPPTILGGLCGSYSKGPAAPTGNSVEFLDCAEFSPLVAGISNGTQYSGCERDPVENETCDGNEISWCCNTIQPS